MVSRFEGLDQFLQIRAASEQAAEDLVVLRREQARRANDPLIRKAFEVFGDFYNRIVAPRVNLRIVAKKKEEPDKKGRITEHDMLYQYLVNLVPDQKDWPYRMSDSELFSNRFYQEGEISGREWTPNVAMQFSVGLHPFSDFGQRKYTDDLQTRIDISVWGKLYQQEGLIEIAGAPIISHGNAWNRSYTIATLEPYLEQLTVLERRLTEVLTMVTPNLLNHREIVRG